MRFLVLIFLSLGFIFGLISLAIFPDAHIRRLLLCCLRHFTGQQFAPVSLASGRR
jgi:hypothetical protein